MGNIKCPCEECIVLAICKCKKEISCILVDDFSFIHDVDPGARGAYARAQYVGDFIGFGGLSVVLLNRMLRTVTIVKREKSTGGGVR